MKRLTVTGRLIITGLVIAGLYFGFKQFGGQKILQDLQAKNQTNATTNEVSAVSNENEQPANAEEKPTFDYQAPVPVGGKLKGVVELGASGFNSFIVKIDEQKRWKLEKAEFGNSLVTENMATEDDIRKGLKNYIAGMLNFGVGPKDIHFVVSSGAVKADVTQKIIAVLKSLNYFVNTVTPQQEGTLGLKAVQPNDYANTSFVVDIGSGNTKISWHEGSAIRSLESYGAKYFQAGTSDDVVAKDIAEKASQIPSEKRKTAFIIGGVPYELAKKVRKGKERYTVLDKASAYQLDDAKAKAGLNIYQSLAETTGCQQFVFDWDANFTIGFLLSL